MKLVRTQPNRRLTAEDGTTYTFDVNGLCVLPDELALSLPQTIYTIVKVLNDQEAASYNSPLNEEVAQVAPPEKAGDKGDETLSEDANEAPSEADSLDDAAGSSSDSGASEANSASDADQPTKRTRRRKQ